MRNIVEGEMYIALSYAADENKWRHALYKTREEAVAMKGYGDFAGWAVVDVVVPEEAFGKEVIIQ